MIERRVSRRVLDAVSRVLHNPENSKGAKVAAGLALTQNPRKKKEIKRH